MVVLLGIGLIVVAYAVLAITVLPGWMVSLSPGAKVDDNSRFNAIVNTRAALLGALAPALAAIGAVAALLQTSAQNRRTYELAQRGQLTERFTKAIEQLGQTAEDKLDIRLGGIYALERIAKESAELHTPVMEILTAFLREHSSRQETPSAPVENEASAARQGEPAGTEEAAPRLRTDFQAIATVLGRRQVSHDPGDFRLDLRDVALAGVNVDNAQLQKAKFYRAQLDKAKFESAQFQGAIFYRAQLQEAYFYGAQLQKAKFYCAQLQDAYFHGADLEGAMFAEPETDLYDALGLTREQLAEARNVDKAVLPNYLARALESQPDDQRADDRSG